MGAFPGPPPGAGPPRDRPPGYPPNLPWPPVPPSAPGAAPLPGGDQEEKIQLLSSGLGQPVTLAYGVHLVGGHKIFEHVISGGADDGKTVQFWALGEGPWSRIKALYINGLLRDHTNTASIHFHPGLDGETGTETDPATPNQKICSFWPSVFGDKFTFSRTAFLALKLSPEFDAPGPSFQVLGEYECLKVRTFDSVGNQTGFVWSANPAWIALDILLRGRVAPRARVNQALSAAEKAFFDFPAFVDWAAACDADIGGGVKRWEAHVAFIDRTDVKRALETVLLLGRAYMLELNGKYSPRHDQARASVFTVTTDALAENSLSLSRRSTRERPNQYIAKYRELDSGKGPGTISTSGTTLTGTGTDFTKRFKKDEPIRLEDGPQAGEVRLIRSVASDTSATLRTAFSADQTARKYSNPALHFQPRTKYFDDEPHQDEVGRILSVELDLGVSTSERVERLVKYLKARAALERQTSLRLLPGSGALDLLPGDVVTSFDTFELDPANTREFEIESLRVETDGSVSITAREFDSTVFTDAAGAQQDQIVSSAPRQPRRTIGRSLRTLIRNSEFAVWRGEDHPEGWEIDRTGGADVAQDFVTKLSGDFSLRYSNPDNATAGGWHGIQTEFELPLRANRFYTLSLATRSTLAGASFRATLYFNAAKTLSATRTFDFSLANSWQLNDWVVQVPSTAEPNSQLVVEFNRNGNSNPQDFWIDSIRVGENAVISSTSIILEGETTKQVSGGPEKISFQDPVANRVCIANFVGTEPNARFLLDMQGNHEWTGPGGSDQNVLLGWSGLGRLNLAGFAGGGLGIQAWKFSPLAATINSTQTSFDVLDGSRLETGRARIEDEIINITSIVGNTLTVQRAQEGTAGASHAAGEPVVRLGIGEAQARIALLNDGTGIVLSDGVNVSKTRIYIPNQTQLNLLAPTIGFVKEDASAFPEISLVLSTAPELKFGTGTAVADVELIRTTTRSLMCAGISSGLTTFGVFESGDSFARLVLESTEALVKFGTGAAAPDVWWGRTADPNSVIGIGLGGGNRVFGCAQFAGDPTTTGWGASQKGRLWFNTTANVFKYWDGSAVATFGIATHALVGADHTASGLTAGQPLRATSATAFAFGPLDLSNSNAITASGAITLAAGGTDSDITLTPSGSGRTILNGRVGMGTPSPSASLHLRDTSLAEIRLEGPSATQSKWTTSGTSMQFGTISSVPLLVLTGNAERLRVDTSGNLGIGNTNPLERLAVGSGAIGLDEIADPAAPAANRARLYARDNGAGKTQLVVRFNTGAVQVLATEP